MPNANAYGPASVVLGTAVSSFIQILPPLADVRKASKDDPNVAGDVRLGEVAAATIAIGVGAISSSLLGDPTPVFVAAIMALALICIWETALRGDRPLDPPRAIQVVTEAE